MEERGSGGGDMELEQTWLLASDAAGWLQAEHRPCGTRATTLQSNHMAAPVQQPPTHRAATGGEEGLWQVEELAKPVHADLGGEGAGRKRSWVGVS